MYGPCKTCIAWLVTEPEELAIGLAVADTPPTPSARAAFPEKILRPLKHIAADFLRILFPFLLTE